ncbi:MAG: hypothetical protein QGD92_06825 [Gammaproteobacteria bacterium]|nr:hypothetical protein [Gammaproteobacteria bacterium]
MQLKTGARLKSTVCDAEVMVITAPDASAALTCGGAPMADAASDTEKGAIDEAHKLGVQIGKRYIDAAAKVEVLCIKPGEGSLALDGDTLLLKDTKKLPKSD